MELELSKFTKYLDIDINDQEIRIENKWKNIMYWFTIKIPLTEPIDDIIETIEFEHDREEYLYLIKHNGDEHRIKILYYKHNFLPDEITEILKEQQEKEFLLEEILKSTNGVDDLIGDILRGFVYYQKHKENKI